ncbi:MAG: hypothetical protein DHS20C14_20670 [Phycisphaeraceae bacterium]|nr:MAG: hypothetical protein DHS20C14_20670 [Phycisphaeraceae bacterium]
MRHLLRNGILVLAVMVFFAGSFWPPAKNLRLGKDLRGGTTFIYAVQIDRSENAEDVLARTIDVLKERVDPQGLYEIRMVAQGNDRIEVTMPLPGPRVKALRAIFDEKLAGLSVQAIEPAEFERVMRLPPGEREESLAVLAGPSESRRERLDAAAAALDDARQSRELYELLRTQPTTSEADLDDAANRAAEGELEYERLRDEALASALNPEDLRRALQLSNVPKILLDEEKKAIELPSPRTRAITRIRDDHPELVDQIDDVIASYDEYAAERTSLDDPNDLKRMLAGAGELSFRITVDPQGYPDAQVPHTEEVRLREELREKGPRNVQSRDARWLKINDPLAALSLTSVEAVEAFYADPATVGVNRQYVVEEFGGEYFMLCWDAPGSRLTKAEGSWSVAAAFPSSDQVGRPAIGFEMDARGARFLGNLTGPHVGDHMAVLLDDEVYTAPNLIARISRNGQITGDFTDSEISYVIRTLTAGSLQARLSPEPISENSIAPELGADNLRDGMLAGIIALCVVSTFMVLYYYGYGLVAVTCLVCNAILILGAMSLGRAAFSLPGIAGVILTFGMAVDANVLIFERIREELRGGKDLRVAVKLGYQKALSSIVDGNVTNLIVCFVLAYTGTPEIKGFAITLGIGVVSTMFSALIISRIIFALLTDKVRVRKMSMLPMTFPFIERALHPKINWIGLRYFCIFVSAIFVALGIFMIAYQGKTMLDTEFRGGTTVTMPFRAVDASDPDTRLTATRSEVADLIHAIGDGLGDEDPLQPLRTADILPINPLDDGVTSSTFQVKTYATDSQAVLRAVIDALSEYADGRPAISFARSDQPDAELAPVYPIESRRLGENVNRPDLRGDVSGFIGGVAILLEDLSPAPRKESLLSRFELMRGKPDFSDTLGRVVEVRVLEGTEDSVRSAVVLVLDEGLGSLDNEEAWLSDVRDREWRLVREALTEPITIASVQNFSPVIARDFKGQAIVAVSLSFLLILIYIWVRFGSVRYSAAAIVALVHDVLIAIGLIALAEIVYEAHFLEEFAAAILIEPFKIDLNLVAALLTIVGYSLNDTIIIMDRIRENRGKLPYASKETVNLAINQTVSRTLITSGTTLLAVLILYIFGGEGVRAFSYALIIGVVVGTYSSIAVASPLVWSGRSESKGGRKSGGRA